MKSSALKKRRHPCGKIIEADRTARGETPEQAQAVVYQQRKRLGATDKDFRDQLWESPVGMMRMWAIRSESDCDGISDQQLHAIRDYIRARHMARWAQGFGKEHPKSISLDLASAGWSWNDPLADEEVIKLRRAYSGVRSALLEYGQRGVHWCAMLDQLAVDDNSHPWRALLGEVRSAANILTRYFGYEKKSLAR